LPPDAVLLDQFLAYLERRREEAQRRFDELTLRRGSMSTLERNLARDSLESERTRWAEPGSAQRARFEIVMRTSGLE
jgi:hypothetical protein